MSLLKAISDTGTKDSVASQESEIMVTLLSELSDCGVDLFEYGRWEEGLYRRGSASREFRNLERYWEGGYIYFRIWKLVGFTYGSSPSDWHVELEQVPEECDGQCEQVQEIPGSWVED